MNLGILVFKSEFSERDEIGRFFRVMKIALERVVFGIFFYRRKIFS